MTGSQPPRVLVLLALSLALLMGLTVDRLRDTSALPEIQLSGSTMGTTFAVRVLDGGIVDRNELSRAIQHQLDTVDHLLSTYDSASEVSRFNRHVDTTGFSASEITRSVLLVGREVSERSNGALDVTVAPIVNAWGFGSTSARKQAPDDEHLRGLLGSVGYRKLRVDLETGKLYKEDPDVSVDLSAIAKGYGVDQVVDLLESRGLPSFLVEVGGEVRVHGLNSAGEPWKVAIEAPVPFQRIVYGVIGMTEGAVATSGDYRDFLEIDGVRYAHIVDPRDGRAQPQKDFSVSVLSSTAVLADAWATALAVLGPRAGYDLALREGIAALFLERTDEGIRAISTPAFPALQSNRSTDGGGPQ